jgi:hypothetical protein
MYEEFFVDVLLGWCSSSCLGLHLLFFSRAADILQKGKLLFSRRVYVEIVCWANFSFLFNPSNNSVIFTYFFIRGSCRLVGVVPEALVSSGAFGISSGGQSTQIFMGMSGFLCCCLMIVLLLEK